MSVVYQLGKSISKAFAQCALLAFALAPAASFAEPIKLKMAYFSSDRTTTYLAAVKPFVDAINKEAAGLMQIEVAINGALGKNPAQQLQLVLDGTADLAFVVPGYTPERFPDNAVIELPGMFSNIREATFVYSGLIAANVLRGYDDLFVIGAFATEPESIHIKFPVASLQDLNGARIRSNNPMQSAALAGLGMLPSEIPINQASSGISSGKLDGAMVSPAPLVEFGIARVAAHHFMLGVSSAPLLVIMTRQRFESLPEQARTIIWRYSGRWTAEHFINTYQAENNATLDSLRQDANRKVVVPSHSDLERARNEFKSEVKAWSAASPRHRELLARAEAELSKIRGETVGQR